MTTDDPDRLRRDIERTQRNLSSDVDLLAEKVTPGRIVHRRVTRARGAMTSLRDKVMGTASDGMSTASDRIGDATSSVAQTASNAAHAVGEAPKAVQRGTEGNPLAAGLIAFGAGWLISSLAPASKREQHMTEQAKDWVQEHGQPVADHASEAAEQLKENLREPAQQAVDSVKNTASDAASTVADETQTAARDGQTGPRTPKPQSSSNARRTASVPRTCQAMSGARLCASSCHDISSMQPFDIVAIA